MQHKSMIWTTCVIAMGVTTGWSQIGKISNSVHVVDEDGKPIKNAMITYTDPAKRLNYAFTDAKGDYPSKVSVSHRSSPSVPKQVTIADLTVSGMSIRFALNTPQMVSVELFDMTGKEIVNVLNKTLEKGAYTVDLGGAGKSLIAHNVYFVKVTTNCETVTRKLTNIGDKSSFADFASAVKSNAPVATIAKRAASIEVRVGRTGYKAVTKKVASETEDLGTVTLTKIDIESRINAILVNMSLDDKAMLMTQDNPEVGNAYKCGTGIDNAGNPNDAGFFNSINDNRMSNGLKIPMLIGYDCVHGFIGSGSIEGTMFPHNVGMGCIQDSSLIQAAGRVTAIESATRGIYWAFAPCIAVCRDEHWGRIYEGPGETPEICAFVARHLILGMQGRDLSLNTTIVATAKHFAGDGGSRKGENAGTTTGSPDAVLRAIHLPPYKAAIEAEVACIMPSFSNWDNGTTVVGSHANKELLTDWLKTEQGFDGFVVGDWWAHTFHGGTGEQACVSTINAGLDNPMAPGKGGETKGWIKNSGISNDRRDDACKRILRVLLRKGLFEDHHALSGYDDYFHKKEHKDVARSCFAASMVVLKNENNTLPLKKGGQKIAVIGKWGNNMGLQCGGWTLGWQGGEGGKPSGTTLFGSLQAQGNGNSISMDNIGDANTVVVCVGNDPKAEYTKSDGDVSLTASGYGKINELMNSVPAGKKIVLVLYTDGPAVVTDYIKKADAVVCVWLGCPEGEAFGDILYGDVHPTGKLSHSWPKSLAQIPINAGNMGDLVGTESGDPLYNVGYGLTY